jgi:hypothetical protein
MNTQVVEQPYDDFTHGEGRPDPSTDQPTEPATEPATEQSTEGGTIIRRGEEVPAPSTQPKQMGVRGCTPEVIARAKELRKQGLSYRAIGERLGVTMQAIFNKIGHTDPNYHGARKVKRATGLVGTRIYCKFCSAKFNAAHQYARHVKYEHPRYTRAQQSREGEGGFAGKAKVTQFVSSTDQIVLKSAFDTLKNHFFVPGEGWKRPGVKQIAMDLFTEIA